jgi:hypothetical protein
VVRSYLAGTFPTSIYLVCIYDALFIFFLTHELSHAVLYCVSGLRTNDAYMDPIEAYNNLSNSPQQLDFTEHYY